MQRLCGTCANACQALLIAATMAMIASHARAQTASALRPVGRISIDQAQLAFIGGAAVGDDLGIGGIGASKIRATGEVYQLARVSDLTGVYGQVRFGWLWQARATAGSGYKTTRASFCGCA
jgi:hypothetical protein